MVKEPPTKIVNKVHTILFKVLSIDLKNLPDAPENIRSIT